MQKYNIIELNEKQLPELEKIAGELGITVDSGITKESLIYRILDEQAISLAGLRSEKNKDMKKQDANKPSGKKRGRPSKADKAAREAELEANKQKGAEEATKPQETENKPQAERKKRSRAEKSRVEERDLFSNEVEEQPVASKTEETRSGDKKQLPPMVAETTEEDPKEAPGRSPCVRARTRGHVARAPRVRKGARRPDQLCDGSEPGGRKAP